MTDTGKLYWSAIKTFGVDLQLAVAIEEMAELTKELCKAQRTIFAARTVLGMDGSITLMRSPRRLQTCRSCWRSWSSCMAPRKKCRKSGSRNSHGWKCGSRRQERNAGTIVSIPHIGKTQARRGICGMQS